MAINDIFAQLRATLPIRAIADDIDNLAEPATELGRRHRAWVHHRGLPTAHQIHPISPLGVTNSQIVTRDLND